MLAGVALALSGEQEPLRNKPFELDQVHTCVRRRSCARRFTLLVLWWDIAFMRQTHSG